MFKKKYYHFPLITEIENKKGKLSSPVSKETDSWI